MLKKILLGVGVLVLVLTILFIYANHRSRTLSPAGIVELAVDDLHVEISYSRPLVRERLILLTHFHC